MGSCRHSAVEQGSERKKKRISLSTLLILSGVLLALWGGGEWLSRYPWRQQLHRWGWTAAPADPVAPAPLPDHLLLPAGAVGETDPAQPGAPAPSLTALGTIKLAKIGVFEHIVEGADSELLYAVGHVRESAQPGQAGNCVLAGHRGYIPMSPFRHLNQLEEQDAVVIEDDAHIYTYEVFRIFEVDPSELWIMEAQDDVEHMLTLVTCTPVVNPTRRLVIWCRLAGIQPAGEA